MRRYDGWGLLLGSALAVSIMGLVVVVVVATLQFFPKDMIGRVDASALVAPYERTCDRLGERFGAGRCVASTDGRILFFSPSGEYLGFEEVR